MTLTETEMIEILEQLAREGGQTARISAIRQLREMNREREADPVPKSGLDRLYHSKPAPGPRRRRGAGV